MLQRTCTDDLLIRLSGLSKTFPAAPSPVLDTLSLDVRAGEFTVLLGASGSGKTTLLRSIIGLEEPDRGVINIAGTRLTRRNRHQLRRRLGMVHQDFSLCERLTAAQNVMTGLASALGPLRTGLMAFPPETQRRAFTLLSRVGLTEAQSHRRIRELSGGQRQRVGIARALIGDPLFLLADEPVSSLDPETGASVLSLMKDMAGEHGTGVLCSLHQIDLAKTFADRIIGLRQGKLVFDAKPDALGSAEIAEIFGSPPTPSMGKARDQERVDAAL
jgi:phosphonate transport system ATP-binding protein